MKRFILIGFILLFLVVSVTASWGSDLCANFAGYGLYKWNGSAWSQLNSVAADNTVASGSDLYANFNSYGLYKWNGSAWSQINSVVATSMVASGSDLYANFNGYGLYKWDGSSWSQINSAVANSMVASGSDLYANFNGYGLYKWNGSSWSQLNSVVPNNMVASASVLYANFANYGLYKWDGNAWSQLNSVVATSMVASGSDLYANFNGYGLYKWDGSTWSQLNSVVAANNMVAFGSDLYANFAGYGVYKWNGSVWSQLNSVVADNMVASGSVLYANFNSYGLYKWNGSAWSQLNPVVAVDMACWSTPVVGATDYFPLNIGDWSEGKDSVSGSIARTSITGPTYIVGVATKAMTYWDGSKEYYTSDENGVKIYGIYVISPPYFTGDIYFDAPLLLIPNNAQLGTTQVSSSSATFSELGYLFNVNITSTTTVWALEDVQTENMILRDCVKVSMRYDLYVVELSQNFSNTSYCWFYKGVGCVKQQVDNKTYTITESYVNGVHQTY